MRFAKSDLIPHDGFGSLDEANAAAACWLAEVNSRPHSETKRPPVELLEHERPLLRSLPALRPAVACGERRKIDRLSTVRLASARYSVPHRLVGKVVEVATTDRELTVLFEGVPVAHHPLLGPGECSIEDAHYPTPPPTGTRPLRPRSEPERSFLALGDEAERYLRAGAARGAVRLHERIDEALCLAATAVKSGPARRWSEPRALAASRAGTWRRFQTRLAARRRSSRQRSSRCGARDCPGPLPVDQRLPARRRWPSRLTESSRRGSDASSCGGCASSRRSCCRPPAPSAGRRRSCWRPWCARRSRRASAPTSPAGSRRPASPATNAFGPGPSPGQASQW